MTSEPEWVFHPPDPDAVEDLTASLGCPEPIAAVLANRGYTDPDAAEQALEPTPKTIHPPGSLPDIDAATERMERALDRDETIIVYADRDVDGISGAAILVTLFRNLGASIEYRVPGKWDGYGLSTDAIAEIVSASPGLLVTVDCGTSAREPIERARAAGLDVIVTDHHHPEGDLPEANACINPRRDDSEYPNRDLAGGAVAFKTGQAIVEAHVPTFIEDYHRFGLPLAAVATVGDYMPLNLENRALVREGFDRLLNCGLPGLNKTARHCKVESMRDIGWSLVPLLNAGQEDEDGDFMLELLLATDSEKITKAISQLEAYRQVRREQREEREEHLQKCFELQIDPDSEDLYLIKTERYVGGVAMSRLSEKWGRPIITYRRKNGHYRGGGRSDPDVNFLELYEACSDLIEDYWGHPGAAGFQVAANNLEAFELRITEALRERYDPEGMRPTVEIDGQLEPEHIRRTLVNAIDRLRPFGNGNEQPEFLIESLAIGDYQTFGEGGRHGKLIPDETEAFTVIHWDGADSIERINYPAVFDIVGSVGLDTYQEKPALTVTDYRIVAER